MADIDYSALAQKYGSLSPQQPAQAPGGYNAPWVGMPPEKVNEMRNEQYKAGQKRIDSLRELTAKGEGVLSELNNFGRLNRQTETGSGWESFMPNTPQLHGSDINEMNAIQSRLGPAQRIQGSGSSSDRDVQLFMGGLPSINKPGPANAAIRADYDRQYKNSLLKQTYLEKYLNTYGHLNGADENWEKQKNALGFDNGAKTTKPLIQQANPNPANMDDDALINKWQPKKQ